MSETSVGEDKKLLPPSYMAPSSNRSRSPASQAENVGSSPAGVTIICGGSLIGKTAVSKTAFQRSSRCRRAIGTFRALKICGFKRLLSIGIIALKEWKG